MSRTFIKIHNKIRMVISMLKEEREKKGYTQEKLAEMSGIDPRTILRIEKGKNVPKITTYSRIIVALGLTNEEIGENIRKIALVKERDDKK